MLKKQKKIALINDFVGYGRCSVAVSLPIISHLKVNCSVVPTSIFSNHMGFSIYKMDDYTEEMVEYMKTWKNLGFTFDGIVSGYLASARQAEMVFDFIGKFHNKKSTQVIIDPVMGDHGKLYKSVDEEMIRVMKLLVSKADIVTPNLTEACFLTDIKFKNEGFNKKELLEIARKIHAIGAKSVVITGIAMQGYIGNVVYEQVQNTEVSYECKNQIKATKNIERFAVIRRKKIDNYRGGTGDMFTAIIAADCVNNIPLIESVKKATKFIQKAIKVTMEFDTPVTDGVCFEEVLSSL